MTAATNDRSGGPGRLAAAPALALLAMLALGLTTVAAGQPAPDAAAATCKTTVPGNVGASTTWTAAASPFCVGSAVEIAAGATLTVEPGVTVYFTAPAAGLTAKGSLVAAGAADKPITLTSFQSSPHPGDWQGIHVPHAGHAYLEHCDVSYGGGQGAGVWIETLDWWTSSVVEIRDSRIDHNQGDGVRLTGFGGWTATMTGSQIDHNTGNAIYEQLSEQMGSNSQYRVPSYQGLSLAGNGTDALVLAGYRYLQTGWTLDGPGAFGGLPIHVAGPCSQSEYATVCIQVGSGYTMTLAPGTELDFSAGPTGGVLVGGSLVAEGTASQPITLTSGLAAPKVGDWRGVQLLGKSSIHLAHCDIGFADRGVAIDSEQATASLRECRIHDNRIGLFAYFSASPTLIGNRFNGNVEYGVWKYSELTNLDASYQWWGHPSGPYHPVANPNGLGDRISDHVIAKPWLMSQSNAPPGIQALAPGDAASFAALPLQFKLRADDPDPDQDLIFRLDIYQGATLVKSYDQGSDPAGWDQSRYTTGDSGTVTATLTLPEALPNGAYTWHAAVFDGFETAETVTRTFSVSLSGWGVAAVDPAEPLAIPNQTQTLSILGAGFAPGAQVWLEQARYGGAVERIDPQFLVAADGKKIAMRMDLTGRSGPWDVRVSQGGVTRQTRIYVLPYMALTSLDYQNTTDLVMNHITPHYLHLANHGTAAGVVMVGVQAPAHTVLLSSLLDPQRIAYLGQVTADVYLFAVPLDPGESQDVAIYWQLPQAWVNLPGDPIDPSKYNWGDPLRFHFAVLAQPITVGWQSLVAETASLEELANGAIWGSALIEGGAIDRYAELGDETAAGEYIDRLGGRYPFVADALIMRQLQEFQLAASAVLGLEDVGPNSAQSVPEAALAPENGQFGDWIRRQVGDPWSFAKGFMLQADENGVPWSTGPTEYERGTFLVAEGEGLIDGLTFGLYRPALGYWNYYHINGNEKGLIDIGHPIGNFLSIPLGAKLPGEFSKGGVNLIRKAADGLRPGGDRYWSIFKLTVEGNTQEPARLGLSVLWKGGDDLASLWKGQEFNLIHWGDNPAFGGSHWGIGWTRNPVMIKGVVQTGAKGEVLFGSGTHIYTNHAFIPYRWNGVPFGELDLSLLRGEINLMHQVPATAWRAGMLEESLRYPANLVDETACGDGSQTLAASWDPNEISGLPNRTHIWPTQPLEFLIRFENVAAATLPAHTVTVTLPVDANLDWDSIQVLGASHPDVLRLHADAAARTLVWTFDGIELPPNKNPPEGEGWARLRVRPKATLSTGQQITAQAEIVFDENRPILTNAVTYTIDLDPPAATVTTEGSAGPWPNVRLSAVDNPGGAGVGSVTLFYSPDGVSWTASAVVTTTQPSATLTGVVPFQAAQGHYWLKAAAADAAGNASPLSAESVEVGIAWLHGAYLPLVSRR
jgi:parallel beta-helix repeat protein